MNKEMISEYKPKLRGESELKNMCVDDINIEDIAHNLSQICRFTGSTPGFYSVAEHSCIVADMVSGYDEGSMHYMLTALLHDAHEAYIGDIIRPIKDILGPYAENLWNIFTDIDDVIRQKFRLKIPFTDHYIHYADAVALDLEIEFFFGTSSWKECSAPTIKCLSPTDAADKFLSMYNSIITNNGVELKYSTSRD